MSVVEMLEPQTPLRPLALVWETDCAVPGADQELRPG